MTTPRAGVSLQDAALAFSPIEGERLTSVLAEPLKKYDFSENDPYDLFEQRREIENRIKSFSLFKRWFGAGKEERKKLAKLDQEIEGSDHKQLNALNEALMKDIEKLNILVESNILNDVQKVIAFDLKKRRDHCKPKNRFFSFLENFISRKLTLNSFKPSIVAAVSVRNEGSLDSLNKILTPYNKGTSTGEERYQSLEMASNGLGAAIVSLNPVMTRWLLEEVHEDVGTKTLVDWPDGSKLNAKQLLLKIIKNVREKRYPLTGKFGSQNTDRDIKAIKEIFLEKGLVKKGEIEELDAIEAKRTLQKHDDLIKKIRGIRNEVRLNELFLPGAPVFIEERYQDPNYVSPLALVSEKSESSMRSIFNKLERSLKQPALYHLMQYLQDRFPRTLEIEKSLQYLRHEMMKRKISSLIPSSD